MQAGLVHSSLKFDDTGCRLILSMCLTGMRLFMWKDSPNKFLTTNSLQSTLKLYFCSSFFKVNPSPDFQHCGYMEDPVIVMTVLGKTRVES